MNGNVVIVRVVGKLPNTGNNDKISIRLSSIAFDKLDAIDSIMQLMQAPIQTLSQSVYNIRAFSPTADEFRQEISKYFPNFVIEYKINKERQNMVDSWPADINDIAAQNDWGWRPAHDLKKGLSNYLIPNVKKIYLKNGDKSEYSTKSIILLIKSNTGFRFI